MTSGRIASNIHTMRNTIKVGIAGCGTIGRRVATELDQNRIPGACLSGISSRNLERAKNFASSLNNPPSVSSIADMVPLVDIVIEAAPSSAMDEIATATLSAGKSLMAMSGGALLDRHDLFDLAKTHGGTIYVPSGAIAGLDGITSAAAGRVDSVTMITRKPPGGLRGSPGIERSSIDLDSVADPVVVYEGPVREAYKLFPANVNVSAAVSMAGIGPDKTTIRIYADPTVTRNTHEVVIEGEFGRLSLKIENVPSEENPRTGLLSALSAIATLKKIASTVQIGT